MGVYDGPIANAKRIIQAKGEACKWHDAVPASTPDTATPWIVAAAPPAVVHDPVFIAFFPLDRRFAQLIRFLKGSDIVVGSLYGIMGAQPFTPVITGIVERKDGSKLNITAIDPLAPNGDTILYTVEFAK